MKAIRHERGFLGCEDRFRMECFPGQYDGGKYTQDPGGCAGDENHNAEYRRSTGHPVTSGRQQKEQQIIQIIHHSYQKGKEKQKYRDASFATQKQSMKQASGKLDAKEKL